jgi:hypothetical protein
MAQIPARAFKSWESDFIKEELFNGIDTIRDHFSREEIDYTGLSIDELKQLGFHAWDENMDMLIPMWLFRLLPDETSLYCPLNEDQDTVLRKDADDDYRFGCSAYCLAKLKNKGVVLEN